MLPSVGRIVHHVSFGTPGGEYPTGQCRAAVVTEVDVIYEGDKHDAETVTVVGLCLLNPTGLSFVRDVRQGTEEEKRPGTWHWPERVE